MTLKVAERNRWVKVWGKEIQTVGLGAIYKAATLVAGISQLALCLLCCSIRSQLLTVTSTTRSSLPMVTYNSLLKKNTSLPHKIFKESASTTLWRSVQSQIMFWEMHLPSPHHWFLDDSSTRHPLCQHHSGTYRLLQPTLRSQKRWSEEYELGQRRLKKHSRIVPWRGKQTYFGLNSTA